jgi:ATP-dependent DNA ligase
MKDNDAFTFSGKAYRPNVVWKSKPVFEDDFIIRWDIQNGIGDYGKGKNKGKVGNVFAYQLDENGDEIYISKVGGGLSDAQREFYTTAEYPRVWSIKFDSIQEKTGSLRFPVFVRDRTLDGDKEVRECLMSEEIKQARKD